MKKIFLILLISFSLFGKDFKMKDGSILSIENTSYGIIVNNKYKLKFTHNEHIVNEEYASIYENKNYKYSISCEGSFCDVVVTNKLTNKAINYGTDNLTPEPVCWVHVYKNGEYLRLLSGGYSLEQCNSEANKYNNTKEYRKQGFKWIVTKEATRVK